MYFVEIFWSKYLHFIGDYGDEFMGLLTKIGNLPNLRFKKTVYLVLYMIMRETKRYLLDSEAKDELLKAIEFVLEVLRNEKKSEV